MVFIYVQYLTVPGTCASYHHRRSQRHPECGGEITQQQGTRQQQPEHGDGPGRAPARPVHRGDEPEPAEPAPPLPRVHGAVRGHWRPGYGVPLVQRRLPGGHAARGPLHEGRVFRAFLVKMGNTLLWKRFYKTTFYKTTRRKPFSIC
jgi:hypothetical protein